MPQDAQFCTTCGNHISWFSVPKAPEASGQSSWNSTVQQSYNPVVSAAYEIPQTKPVKEKSHKGIVWAIIVGTILVIATILALNMKKCDNCGLLFWGQGHNFLGYAVCDRCWY